jgi:hypothetical protein
MIGIQVLLMNQVPEARSENNEVVDMRMRIIARKVLLHGHCYCHGNPNQQDVALIEQKVKFHKNYYLCI